MRIDEVRGNAEPFDGVFDVSAYRVELGHSDDSPPRGARPQLEDADRARVTCGGSLSACLVVVTTEPCRVSVS